MPRVPLPLAQLALSAINHVLQQQPASRERMRIHAGRNVRIVTAGPIGDMHSDAQIGADGLLAAAREADPAVVLTLAPTLGTVFGVLGGSAQPWGRKLRVEGDAVLAATVAQVAESLRWDFEEDLSKVLGDTVAHRVGRAMRGAREGAEGVRARSREAIVRVATTRAGPLVAQTEMADLADEIRRLSASIARLEARRPLSSDAGRSPPSLGPSVQPSD